MTSNHAPRRRRVLFVAYTFPPVGGGGVQRTAKFTKYLPQFGWDTSVLTASNPSVPVMDESLSHDVPESTVIIRARTFEPSYSAKRVLTGGGERSQLAGTLKAVCRRVLLSLLQPDPQILWDGPAFLAAIRTLRRVPHDVVVATAPPFSSLLLGAAISRHTRLPLVLDFRDEWKISNAHWENRRLGSISAAVQAHMERYALRHAKAVIATSPRSARTLADRCRELKHDAQVTCLYNGFDPDDFDSIARLTPQRPSRCTWRLVYTGTLFSLTSPKPLVDAIEHLAKSEPRLVQKLEFVLAGRRTAEQDQLIRRLSPLCRLETHDYVAHEHAIRLMLSADVMCVLLSDVVGAARVIPAKIFEYFAARRPILGIVPKGDAWDLLSDHPAAFTYEPHDVPGICAWLSRWLRNEAFLPDGASLDLRAYDRRAQAESLAAVLNDVAASAGPVHRMTEANAYSG